MIRANKQVVWSEFLEEEDLPYLSRWIESREWYPMETYERMGLAILETVAHGDLSLIHRWGRETVDLLCEQEPDLLALGDPRETFARFHVLRQSLFDFPAVEATVVRDGKALLEIDYGMSSPAEEAACHLSMGFLERLLELCGAEEIDVSLTACSWEGAERTEMTVRWRPMW
jgi:hypothetical protein